jgi:hypothetical protein
LDDSDEAGVVHFKPTPQANYGGTTSNSVKRRFRCDYCSKKENGRQRIMTTHSTDRCFYGDKEGFEQGNKPSNPYFFDTGTTPISFVNTMKVVFLQRTKLNHLW